MITRLAASNAEGPVNVGSADTVDLGALAGEVITVARARGLTGDGPERQVAIYTPKRPPMALDRLRAAIGDWPITDSATALGRYFEWHSSLSEPRPF